MRKFFIFLAYILTLGVAVVIGSFVAYWAVERPVLAQTQAPRDAVSSTVGRVHSTDRIAQDASYPLAPTAVLNANQNYNSLAATPNITQSGQAHPSYTPSTPAPGYKGEYFTKTVPDPNNPGQTKDVTVAKVVPVENAAGFSSVLDESAQQIARLSLEMRQGGESSADPEKLQELRKLVAAQFDKRHKSQVARLEEIQADLQRTQEILDRRNEQGDKIIERRIAQLLGEQDPLQWDYQPAVPHPSPANQNYEYRTLHTYPAIAPQNDYSRPPSAVYPSNSQQAYVPGPYVPYNPPNSPDASKATDVHSSGSYGPQSLEQSFTSPDATVAISPISPDANDLVSLVGQIQESRKVLAESADLDAAAVAALQPKLDKAKEQLAHAQAKLSFHKSTLLHSMALKELDLADAQKNYEAANIEAQNAQTLYDKKIVTESEARLGRLKAEVAKNAMTRAELELSEIDQRLKWLNSFQETTSSPEQLPQAPPETAEADEAPLEPNITSEATPSQEEPIETRLGIYT